MTKEISQEGPLVQFYREKEPDTAGRRLSQILAWSDDQLEYTHDYIQWLFPLQTYSQFNDDAPILDEAQINIFRGDRDLQAKVLEAFRRMLRFYGFDYQDQAEESDFPPITRSANWQQHRANWLTSGNHNFLRITRILTSLQLLGLESQAQAFFRALQEIYQQLPQGQPIGPTSFNYWKAAAGDR